MLVTVHSRPRRTVSLSEASGRDLPMDRVAEALIRSLSGALSATPVEASLTAEEEERVGRLIAHKYGDSRWNRFR